MHELSRTAYDGCKKMKREKSFYSQIGEYSSMAFVLPVSCLVGYAIGYYLDKFFETHFLNIVFILLGAASGLLQLYRQISKDTKDDDGA